MSKKPFQEKPDRQGVIQPGKSRRDNEYKPDQRNPEPTTRITPPGPPPQGKLEAGRLVDRKHDGDNRALNETDGTTTPYVPMPHDSPEWSETPEGQYMRVVELLATNQIQRPQAKEMLDNWLDANLGNISRRGEIETKLSYLSGRIGKANETVMELFARSIEAKIPPDVKPSRTLPPTQRHIKKIEYKESA